MAQPLGLELIHIIMIPFLILPLLYFTFKQMKKSPNPPLPPGPTPWPIITTINHLLKPMSHVDLANMAKTYGPLMLFQIGTQNLVVGSSAQAAVEILKTNDRMLSARVVPHSVPLTRTEIDKMSFWADADSKHWINIRTICRAELFSAKALESQANMMEQKMVEMVERLRSMERVVINVQNIVFATVVNYFSNVFFSKDVVRVDEEFDNVNEVRGLLRGIIVALSAPNLSDLYPFMGNLDLHGLRRKHKEMSIKMCGLWEAIVKERREESSKGELNKHDFLASLLSRGFGDDQINKLFEELFTAGIDTTTATITRTMTELVSNPKCMTKLKHELDNNITSFNFKNLNIAHLPYLNTVVKETLRLHPPAPLLLSHRASQTCRMMNRTIPENSRVLVNVWAIGRDTEAWEAPSEYRPERFVGSSLEFKGSDFEFLPFGSGRRICPGMPMAAKIVPLVVANLVSSFDWSICENESEKLRTTSRVVEPLQLIALPRVEK